MSGVSSNWALDEVDKRVPPPPPPPPPTSTPTAATDAWQWKTYADHLRHFAAILIAKHEERPVDQVKLAAQDVHLDYYNGKYSGLNIAFEIAVRRGIELGKEGAV